MWKQIAIIAAAFLLGLALYGIGQKAIAMVRSPDKTESEQKVETKTVTKADGTKVVETKREEENKQVEKPAPKPASVTDEDAEKWLRKTFAERGHHEYLIGEHVKLVDKVKELEGKLKAIESKSQVPIVVTPNVVLDETALRRILVEKRPATRPSNN